MSSKCEPLDDLSDRQTKLFAEAIVISTCAFTPRLKDRLQDIVSNQLDGNLLRPKTVTRLLTGGQSRYTPLCNAHKPLNDSSIHSLFSLFRLEIGARMDKIFNAGRDHVGHGLWDSKILNLRSLHGLWMPVDGLSESFQKSLSLGSHAMQQDHCYRKWRYESSGCEACMISRIVSDQQTLFDLWALVQSRVSRNTRSRKPKVPRLLRWIESWVELHVTQFHLQGEVDLAEQLVEGARNLTDEFYLLRKVARQQEEKHRSKRRRSFGVGLRSSAEHRRNVKLTSHDAETDRPQESQQARTFDQRTEADEVKDEVDSEQSEDELEDELEEEQAFQQSTHESAAAKRSSFYHGMSNEQCNKATVAVSKDINLPSSRYSPVFGVPFNSATDRHCLEISQLPTHQGVRQSAISRWTDASVPLSESEAIAYPVDQEHQSTTPCHQQAMLKGKSDQSANIISAISRWTDASVPLSESEAIAYPVDQEHQSTTPCHQQAMLKGKSDQSANIIMSKRHQQDPSSLHIIDHVNMDTKSISNWASEVTQTVHASASKARVRNQGSKGRQDDPYLSAQAQHRQPYLLDEDELAESIVSRTEIENCTRMAEIKGPTTSNMVDMATTFEGIEDSGSEYTFQGLLKRDIFPLSREPVMRADDTQPLLLPLRYDPHRPVHEKESGATAALSQSEDSNDERPIRLTDIPHALRPFSGISQQTTWTGMYKNLAVINGRHSVLHARVPLEHHILNKQRTRDQAH